MPTPKVQTIYALAGEDGQDVGYYSTMGEAISARRCFGWKPDQCSIREVEYTPTRRGVANLLQSLAT